MESFTYSIHDIADATTCTPDPTTRIEHHTCDQKCATQSHNVDAFPEKTELLNSPIALKLMIGII